MTKQNVEQKRLRGRYDIVARQLQDEYSVKNGWAIKQVHLIANQLDAIVERVGVTEVPVAKLATTVEDVKPTTAKPTTKRATKAKAEDA